MKELRSKMVLIAARVVIKELIKVHGYEVIFPSGNLALINIWVRYEDNGDSEIEVEKITEGISYKGEINLPHR